MILAFDTSIAAARSTQTAAPANGGTVPATDTPKDLDIWLTPAGTIASATVTLPQNGPIGQVVTIGTSQAITLLNLTGAGSILNALNTLNAGDVFQMKKLSATTWARLT